LFKPIALNRTKLLTAYLRKRAVYIHLMWTREFSGQKVLAIRVDCQASLLELKEMCPVLEGRRK